MSTVKGLFFDVFGTCTDWRSTVTETLHARCKEILNASTSSISSVVRLRASEMTVDDWGSVAQKWREKYYEFCLRHDPTSDFVSIDEHHYQSFLDLVYELGLAGLWDDFQIREISLVWHYLRAWPDVAAGIGKLNLRYLTSSLSNGNLSLLSDLAKTAPLPFQRITSAEEFRAYKPSPLVYRGGAEKLELEPGECGMVAAHLSDLQAAKACGFKAFYVERPGEEMWDTEKVEQARHEGWVDEWISADQDGFLALARKLGIS